MASVAYTSCVGYFLLVRLYAFLHGLQFLLLEGSYVCMAIKKHQYVEKELVAQPLRITLSF